MNNLQLEQLRWTSKDKVYEAILDSCVDPVPGIASGKGQPCVVGPPQAGKTRLVNHWAAKRGFDVLTVNLQLDLPEDLGGYPVRDGDRVKHTLPTIIPEKYINSTKPWVLFFDEIDKASPEVLSTTLTALNERRIRYTQIKPQLIVCAANFPKGKLPEALMARLLWLPYPPAEYDLLERDSFALSRDVLADIYPKPEPAVPELDLWYGSAHRLEAWQADPHFWNVEIMELVLHGSFPTAKAEAIFQRLQPNVSINVQEWAESAGPAQVKTSILAVFAAATGEQRNEAMVTLQQRAIEDQSGEMSVALNAWCSSAAAQAFTDSAAGKASTEAIRELRKVAQAQIDKNLKTLQKEQKNAENQSSE